MVKKDDITVKTMDEYYDKTFKILDNAGIQVKDIYLKKIYNEMLKNKGKLNKILNLNEGNNYRHIEKYRITNHRFEIVYPKTTRMIKSLAGDNQIDIVKNTIMIGKNSCKLSKYIQSEFAKGNYGNRSNMSYVYEELETSNNIVSRICDLTKERNLCISTNIYDMITSSTNSSYSSCYKIGGEYFNGNLAYMRDKFTVICFIYGNDIHHKIGRDWCYVFPDEFKILMSNRQYGSIFKADRKEMRIYIGKKISEHHNVRSYWKMENVQYNSNLYFNGRPDHTNGSVYFDSSSLSFSYHKFKASDKHKPVLEFKQSRCLKCGLLNFHHVNGVCGKCTSLNYTCHDCGVSMTEDDYIMGLDNHKYCFTCFDNHYFECEDCGLIIDINKSFHNPDGYKTCKSCFDDHYRICSCCTTTIHKDNSIWYEGEIYCDKCFSEQFRYCDGCGEHYPLNEMKENLCENCYNEIYSVCEGCNNDVHNDNIFSGLNKEVFCRECYQKKYMECSECHKVCINETLKDGICKECITKMEKPKKKTTKVVAKTKKGSK